ncbi:dihydroxyacetone kinase subunit DhaL [Cellulosilyticum sp. I15G10I2]|uniref:dihydroxyacetone kinase subunit DhaL n=1 Tax=Cellulosilyticum sp. I15G10I2 TaxID=1892843 RepID=UPI00085BE34E|nr:dihydroxyacetone kinase subunit DhaL [Cellulosilyticum sp. I15G10I2]
MGSFKNKDGKILVENLIKVIQDNKDYLSKIDGEIGDGDHGINMNKGFSICEERIADKAMDLSEALKTLAMVLMMEIGGSMGPLYGTLFIEMSKAAKGEEDIDKQVFYKMLNSAVRGIQQLGNAKVGDKTLMDTLVPALEAYKQELDADSDFTAALEKMCKAAEKGKDSTIDLVAKVGRASRLGERSRGVLDAGATSCCLIIQSVAGSIIQLVK